MSLFTAIAISSSGLTAQRARIEILVSNLVNAHTTRADGKGPYQRRDVIFRATPLEPSFGQALDEAMMVVRAVEVVGVVKDNSEPIRRYEPGHPHADKEGYVLYPNINPMEELVNMLSATRSYEANLQVVNSVKNMVGKTLEIIR